MLQFNPGQSGLLLRFQQVYIGIKETEGKCLIQIQKNKYCMCQRWHIVVFSDKTFKRLMICVASSAICQTESISFFLKRCSERFLNIKLQNFVRFGCPASLDFSEKIGLQEVETTENHVLKTLRFFTLPKVFETNLVTYDLKHKHLYQYHSPCYLGASK